jgi:hypothetical protein
MISPFSRRNDNGHFHKWTNVSSALITIVIVGVSWHCKPKLAFSTYILANVNTEPTLIPDDMLVRLLAYTFETWGSIDLDCNRSRIDANL